MRREWRAVLRSRRFAVALLTIGAVLTVAVILSSTDLGQRAFATPVCENGTVIPNPVDHPELVADCEALLEAKNPLRGAATLNWGADRRLSGWHGVTVGTVDGVRRVTQLDLDGRGLNGVISAALGRLTGLSRLQLAWGNQLTGSIPPELGQLSRLTDLNLAANRLTGPIPPELGAIGPQLTDLILSGPRPLPEGVGLSGSIPAQLGNLTGLEDLYLDGNRLSGSIPTRLGRLTNLDWLHLARNQLSGSIPTQLGGLSNLTDLRLESNSLSGELPLQLGGLRRLRKVYLKNNAGFTGCAPPNLRAVRRNDIDQLGLPDCASDAPATPETPVPTFTLTATAGGGGAVDPSGVTTHQEGAEVTVTASWNDATHTFSGWSGACSGTATTCQTAEIYSNLSVAATFTPLPADRCASPTDADCIRAVYLGAPEDYAQVQDIPADKLLSPDSDGRYQVDRGPQYTVVTAAPLPTGFDRFYPQLSPDATPRATSAFQLIRPVGTTYTFTVNPDERAANLFTYHLYSARTSPSRPGSKPSLGSIVVTTEFLIPTLRYNRLDITGAASTAGSYSFLTTSGDTSSAIDNFGRSAAYATELRLNPADASGASRQTFYDTVAVGDTFDYKTKPRDCGFRFSVTRVSSTNSTKSFALDLVSEYGGRCRGFVDDPSSAHDVQFVWRPPPGIATREGVRELIEGEPVGPGTYKLWEPVPWVLDVPAGITITRGSVIEQSPEPDDPNPIYMTIMIHYDEAGVRSTLHIDVRTGLEGWRAVHSPGAASVFDQIVDSIRARE